MKDFAELLAVLAHEMRTPIAAILGYQELLADGIYGKVDERGQEPLHRIAYSARQLLHLIDGAQEIGTPESQRLSTQVEPFQPALVLQSCLANAGADATGRHVQLEAAIPDSLPQITGDPDRFCRAIDLALAAAIKTSHGATLVCTARAHDGGTDITISGTGLDPERDAPGTVRPGASHLTGAGLRLAIAHEITRQMHGSLKLQPEPSGTTLILRFDSQDSAPRR